MCARVCAFSLLCRGRKGSLYAGCRSQRTREHCIKDEPLSAVHLAPLLVTATQLQVSDET